jgi:hypothetical protein
VALAVALGAGHVAGRAYRPQPLSPSAAEIAPSDRFVVLFGNSHFEAGISAERLAAGLSSDGKTVRTRAFNGGGWDALHYLMLAQLSKNLLRPNRDVAVIEVSMQSLDDANDHNRLGAIRPEATAAIAKLPGAPVEMRLDLLLGAVDGLYRYRLSLQGMVGARLENVARSVGNRLHLAGELRQPPKFELVTMPGMDFVIKEVRGDRSAFQQSVRAKLSRDLAGIRVGGYKLAALELAVETLRSRGIEVWLVDAGTSRWYDAQLRTSSSWAAYDAAVQRLAKLPHVHYAGDWPAVLSADDQFWDETHRVGTSAERFTDELAVRIRAWLNVPSP